MSAGAKEIIRIAAAAIVQGGAVLTVRKHGGTRFMLPGGKYEADEAPLECLARELDEELGVGVASAEALGRFEAPAADHPEATVVADVFVVEVSGDPRPQAEIAEARWITPGQTDAPPLAQLLETQVFPALLGRAAR
ncbi:MAG: NUDIX domain-containing protein [Proteobacteria bacterium]|nr:NUDIX domain-containing protein [Pseudomonadota bacterium]